MRQNIYHEFHYSCFILPPAINPNYSFHDTTNCNLSQSRAYFFLVRKRVCSIISRIEKSNVGLGLTPAPTSFLNSIRMKMIGIIYVQEMK